MLYKFSNKLNANKLIKYMEHFTTIKDHSIISESFYNWIIIFCNLKLSQNIKKIRTAEVMKDLTKFYFMA